MTGLKLSRRTLKIIAIAAMLTDHSAYLFIHKPFFLYAAMRCVGRLTAPIMCFFIAEGYRHTSSKLKYWTRLLVFAILSQVPYTLVFDKKVFTLSDLSMIFTLFMGFSAIWAFDSIKNKWIGFPVVLAFTAATWNGDWFPVAVVWCFVFYYFEDMKMKLAAFALSTSGFLTYIFIRYSMENINMKFFCIQLAVLLAIPLIYAYDGKKQKTGKAEKYFFYVFYPAHLLVLWGIKTLLN